MHSFYNFGYVIKLPIKNITRLLIKANDKQKENSAWELYVAIYPKMTEETFIPFEEFYNNRTTKIEDKSEEEILEDVKGIIDTFNESR